MPDTKLISFPSFTLSVCVCSLWYYGEWQSAYENLDIPNLHLEGLPTSFDASKRNVVVLDDLMAETDERVTNLFTQKATTVILPSYISCKTCFQKTRRIAPSV